MQSFKRLIIVLIALVLAASVVFFTLENRALTQIVFFGWQTPELPMALYVLGAFILGLVIGPVTSWWPHQRMRMRCNKQAKLIKGYEQRLADLQQPEEPEPVAQLPQTQKN